MNILNWPSKKISKTLLAFLVSVSLLNATKTFAGGKDGAGGDPLNVIAKQYPNPEKLNNALQTAVEKISTIENLNPVFSELKSEVIALAQAEKYKYIPQLIILGKSEGVETYELPKDIDTFLSLGAMTYLTKGTSVYLSERSLNYSNDQFAKILIHEALHHVLFFGLAEDEDFVDELANQIYNGQISETMIRSIQNLINLNANSEKNADQFASSFMNLIESKKMSQDTRNLFAKAISNDLNNIMKQSHLKSLLDIPFEIVITTIAQNIYWYTNLETSKFFTYSYFQKYVKKLNFKSSDKIDDVYCKDGKKWFGKCKSYWTLRDYMIPVN